jgi:type II secretory pathway pseudopilin PulG
MNVSPPSPSAQPSHRTRAAAGFSLIELLGALTILTILAMALAPVLVREYDRHARERETKSLETLAAGFRSHVLRTRTIPGHNEYIQAVATEIGMQTSDVVLNHRRLPRVLLIDPAVTNVIPIPYTQNFRGLTNSIPLSLGMVLISSVSAQLPSGLVSGFASSSAAFNAIWSAAENTVPAGWSWSGRGEDLRIIRINLGTLFVPLALNYDAITMGAANRGRFTIDGSATNTLPTTPTFISNYLISSVLGLHHHSGSTDTLQAQIVLQTPTSFTYQGSAWRGQAFLTRGSTPTSAIDLQTAHDFFVSSPDNDQAQGSPAVTPEAVVDALAEYMQAFVDWRDAGYPTRHRTLDDAQDNLDEVTDDLLHHVSDDGDGDGGCDDDEEDCDDDGDDDGDDDCDDNDADCDDDDDDCDDDDWWNDDDDDCDDDDWGDDDCDDDWGYTGGGGGC